jgi:hypothetical protein
MVPTQTLAQVVALFFAGADIEQHNRFTYANTNEGITLIDGSTRAEDSHETAFTKKLWNEDNHLPQTKKVNLSHQENPNVITLDIQKAVGRGKHIQGDATQCKISESADCIYLERVGTYDTAREEGFRVNTIQAHLKNLIPVFRPGDRQILIEWHPYTIQHMYYDPVQSKQKNLCTFLPERNLEDDRKTNPFTGFFDVNTYRPALFFAINKDFPVHTYPVCFIEEARKLTPVIDEILKFYEKQGLASREALNRRLLLECEILEAADRYIRRNEGMLMAETPDVAIEGFNEKVDHIFFPSLHMSYGLFTKCSQLREQYYPISPQLFLAGSLYYLLQAHVATFVNRDLVKECIEKLGGKNVCVYYGTSPVNNRTNVCLVSALYAKTDIPEKSILFSSNNALKFIVGGGLAVGVCLAGVWLCSNARGSTACNISNKQ